MPDTKKPNGNSMIVCVLATSYPRFLNDHASVFVHGLAKHLCRLNLEVRSVVPHEAGLPLAEVLEGVNLFRFRYFWPLKLQQLAYGFGMPDNIRRKFWAKINVPFFLTSFFFSALKHAKGSSVLHCHWEIAALIGIWVKAFRGTPVVYTVHRLVARSFIMKQLTRYIFSHVDEVHFNSEFTREQAKPFLHPTTRSKIIYPSIDVQWFSDAKDEGVFRRRFGIPIESPIILGLGRMVEKKGFAFLIDAFNHLGDEKAHLVFAGGGPLQEELMAKARLSPHSKRIHFTGFIQPSEIRGLLKECMMMVVPSITDRHGETETLGTVAMEALAAGAVVIASRVGGIPDVIVDGESGLLVEPANPLHIAQAIKQCLTDSALRSRLQVQGLKRVTTNFTWQSAASKTVESYARIKLLPTGVAD